MRRSSKTGYFGVQPCKRDFQAVYTKGPFNKHTIATAKTPEEAAKAWDEWVWAKKDVEYAYRHTNFITPARQAQFESHRKAVGAREEAKRISDEELRMNTPLLPERIKHVMAAFLAGETVEKIAIAEGAHPAVVHATIKENLAKQLSAIGLSSSVAPTLEDVYSGERMKAHVEQSLAKGESIRSVSERMSLDRKLISRWIGRKEG